MVLHFINSHSSVIQNQNTDLVLSSAVDVAWRPGLYSSFAFVRPLYSSEVLLWISISGTCSDYKRCGITEQYYKRTVAQQIAQSDNATRERQKLTYRRLEQMRIYLLTYSCRKLLKNWEKSVFKYHDVSGWRHWIWYYSKENLNN